MSYNSGTGSLAAWEKYLLNTYELVDLMVSRMERDYQLTGLKLRKAYSGKDLGSQRINFEGQHILFFFTAAFGRSAQEKLQKLCGAYLAAVAALKAQVPDTFLQTHLPDLERSLLDCRMI